ncbi:Fur-regulated basic protein FbpA [Metabacillus sp. B2-18]|uniref:Fur-regulated basic protein FbpA n=1 Tax=Metabacillus sp. B2-18 TaxID=2897333 RepID=UPI001E426956|nr:Fur-regulated basic protein FbpA [Metabacillus sp. B2-18]UGB31681.1 Fur-regulated basic protein FbpA [Metabacillus sp. B2-18]
MRLIQHMEDYYRSELLNMGYFKTPDGRQLYELEIEELRRIYDIEKFKVSEK